MAFYGYEFIYNSFYSSAYGLVISDLNQGSVLSSPQGSELIPITKKLLRNPEEYVYGFEQGPSLEMDFTITSQNPISAMDRNIIASQLFGQQEIGTLRIIQDDLADTYYKCIFTKSEIIYVGNLAMGWKVHVRNFSPFAYGNTQTITRNYVLFANEIYTYNNLSANSYYTYPIVSFKISAIGLELSITNSSDNNRIFRFSMLSSAETIVADCQRQIVSSDTGFLRISNFNLKWLRFVPGINILNIVGGIEYLTLQIPMFKKVGA